MGFPWLQSIFTGLVVKRIDTVLKVLRSDGDNFFQLDRLRVFNPNNDHSRMTVGDQETLVFSVHDFLRHESVEDGYQRFVAGRGKERMDKFIYAIKNLDRLQILRTNEQTEKLDKIIELHDVIYEMRGGKRFDLYVFQDSDFMRNNWGIPCLHTFYTQPLRWDGKTWEGRVDMWDKFLLMLQKNSWVAPSHIGKLLL